VTASQPTAPVKLLERLLSALALAYGLAITAGFWFSVAPRQSMWPFPGLYFIEVVFLPALLAFSVLRGSPQRARIASLSAGALSVFSILGAMSVGLFYLPLVLLAAVTAVVSRVVTRETLAGCAAFFVGSAALQACGMLFPVSVA
jgi:hypothetical protein